MQVARTQTVDRTNRQDRFRRVQLILAALSSIIACLVLFGWAFDIGLIKALRPHWAAMKVNSAICVIALSVAIFFLKPPDVSSRSSSDQPLMRREIWAVVFAFYSAFMGAATLVEDLWSINLGIDDWFTTIPLGEVRREVHMGPNSALCFLLLGSAIITMVLNKRKQGIVVSQLLAFIASFVAFFAVAGYVFDVSQLYRIASFTSMALHTACVILMLTTAILCAQADAGFMGLVTGPSVGGFMARRLGMAMVLINFGLGWVTVRAEREGLITSGVGTMFFASASIFLSILWINNVGREVNLIDASRRGTERLLKEVINSAPAGIYLKDLDGELILANSEFEKEIYRGPDIERSNGVSRHDFDKNELTVMRTGRRVDREEELRIDGQAKTFLSSRFPIYDSHDRMIGICGVMTDISQRKNYELRLRQSEEGLRTLADAIPSIVWTARSDGVIDYFNKRWFEYTGLNFSSFSLWHWPRVIHRDDLSRVREGWLRSVREGAPFKGEIRLLRADGAYRWHLMLGLPQKIASGEPVRWFGSITDIDDQKRQTEWLEKKVAERTRELIRANQELEAFSYSVSHDLRAPLRSMDGFSQLLLDRYASGFDETGKTYLRRVRTATQSMAGLIDDLLTLSRISRTELVREPVDLSKIVAELACEKRRDDPNRNVKVVIQSGAVVEADASLMRIALWNLIDNAWKYSSKVPDARIEFGASEEQGEQRVFTVRDNGAGFEMSHAAQLFKPFQRLHLATDFPGTGIGLATAHRIIERHGGRMWATGAPNQGASFHFTIGGKEKRDG